MLHIQFFSYGFTNLAYKQLHRSFCVLGSSFFSRIKSSELYLLDVLYALIFVFQNLKNEDIKRL